MWWAIKSTKEVGTSLDLLTLSFSSQTLKSILTSLISQDLKHQDTQLLLVHQRSLSTSQCNTSLTLNKLLSYTLASNRTMKAKLSKPRLMLLQRLYLTSLLKYISRTDRKLARKWESRLMKTYREFMPHAQGCKSSRLNSQKTLKRNMLMFRSPIKKQFQLHSDLLLDKSMKKSRSKLNMLQISFRRTKLMLLLMLKPLSVVLMPRSKTKLSEIKLMCTS